MNDSRWTLDRDINAFLETMELPPAPVMQAYAEKRAPIEAAAPQPGDIAPEFDVEQLTADGQRSGQRIRLRDLRGMNLALLFGSYTCPVYRGQIELFNEIHAEFQDRVAFLLIYTSEAHPEDGWQVGINESQSVVYRQPVDPDARAAIAADCITRHEIAMPVAIDDMDNRADKLYSGSPERLYLVDAEGIVQHRSDPGPFNLSEIEKWYLALNQMAGERRSHIRLV